MTYKGVIKLRYFQLQVVLNWDEILNNVKEANSEQIFRAKRNGDKDLFEDAKFFF